MADKPATRYKIFAVKETSYRDEIAAAYDPPEAFCRQDISCCYLGPINRHPKFQIKELLAAPYAIAVSDNLNK
jgi:hypothetical protein